MHIEYCTSAAHRGWLELRNELWPQPRERHVSEMSAMADSAARFAAFVAYDEAGQPAGFAEAALRTDYVNGALSSPVAFVEGLYVAPRARRRGMARALVAAVAQWSSERGCSELASDALLANEASQAMHRALGFQETERVVFFRKPLRPARRGT